MNLIQLIIALFKKPIIVQEKEVVMPAPIINKPIENVVPQIDWTNPKANISKYFIVKEALYLPSWDCYHIPSDTEKKNILLLAARMDKVREYLGKPISVSCWIRPSSLNCPGNPNHGRDYNAFVKGAKRSAHLDGQGVDWNCKENCDETRNKLISKLIEFDLRMEDLPNSNWVHIDSRSIPGQPRFFKP